MVVAIVVVVDAVDATVVLVDVGAAVSGDAAVPPPHAATTHSAPSARDNRPITPFSSTTGGVGLAARATGSVPHMAGFLRLILAAVLLAIVARVIDKVRHRDADQPPPEWPAWGEREATTVSPQPAAAADPAPADPVPADDGPSGDVWADPIDGQCPPGFPVKVKLSSGIYHVEGMMNWERTHADRCYVSAEAAEADGYRASKI